MCLGIVGSPDTVIAAYEAGVNFFFLTADLHWPLYEQLRKGLVRLFADKPSARREVVVCVVSYLRPPLFSYLQFHEVLDSVPGLDYVDVLVGGAISDHADFSERFPILNSARNHRHAGAALCGCSFHDRSTALMSANHTSSDLNFVRFNPSHPNAKFDLFPFINAHSAGRTFNFKSTLPGVIRKTAQHQNAYGSWMPAITDYYRYAFTEAAVDGILCSWDSPEHVEQFNEAMKKGSLTAGEVTTMELLSQLMRQ